MRPLFRGAGSAAALCGALWLYHVLSPSNEQRIRQLLHDVATCTAVVPNEPPLARVAKANKLAGYFTSDVAINLDQVPVDLANIVGRDQLRQVILVACANLRQLHVQLLGATVQLDPNQTLATVLTTATVEVNGEKNAVVQELRFTLRKTERRWLIAEVNTISTLK